MIPLSTRLEIENPLRANDGSDKVEVSQPQHGFSVGEAITVSDATALGGINASNINGARTIHEVIDENTYSFTAGALQTHLLMVVVFLRLQVMHLQLTLMSSHFLR